MAKLTKAQLIFLERSERQTLPDNSGSGAIVFNGMELRTAMILVARGLLRPLGVATGIGHHLHGARITNAGRAALKENTDDRS